MVYPPEATGEEFGTVEETKAFLQGAEARPEALYNPDKENQECGVLRESDPEWKSMFKAETADAGLVEELRNATVGIAAAVDEAPLANSDNVWTEVMEEDTMTMEPGLVFFSVSVYVSHLSRYQFIYLSTLSLYWNCVWTHHLGIFWICGL